MKYIITESQKTRLELLTFMTKEELASYISHLDPLIYPCSYKNIRQFIWAVRYEMENTLTTDAMESLPKDLVWKEILNMFGEEIIDFYYERCDPGEFNIDDIKREYLGVKVKL
jgi:hypothetical protein